MFYLFVGELTLKLDDPLGVATGDGSELGTVVTMSASDVSGSASAAVSGAFVSDDLSKWGDLYLPHADPLDSPLNAADKFLWPQYQSVNTRKLLEMYRWVQYQTWTFIWFLLLTQMFYIFIIVKLSL